MLIFHGLLTVFLIGIFVYDLTRYIIPNWMTAVVLALYPVMWLTTPVMPEGFNIWMSLAIFAAMFAVGAGLFALKWMGGGDVKLLAVLGLWAGAQAAVPFLIYTALLGGLLALSLVPLRGLVGRYMPVEKAKWIPRVLRDKEPLPYGLAITAAFLVLLWMGKIPGLPVAWG